MVKQKVSLRRRVQALSIPLLALCSALLMGCGATSSAPPSTNPNPIPPSGSGSTSTNGSLGISAVAVTSSTTSALITWKTSANSDSQVQYGTTGSYGQSTPLNSTLETAHQVTIQNLASSTTYHFQVQSRDTSGNSAVSQDATFTTTHQTAVPPQGNAVTVYEESGSAQSNYSVSVPRVFKQGDISQFAQAVINGTPVLTQCDVKNRWSDGSLKFAIVSFVIPTLPASGSVQIAFQNQSTGNNTGYLDAAGMLDSSFDFEGQIQINNGAGNANTISARTMLSAGKFSYWLQGPIVTAVAIEDRSGRSYDINADGQTGNPLHPMFEAWFYPLGQKKVDLGYTLENAWLSNTVSSSARDQTYAFTLTAGSASPRTVFTQPSFTHIGWSRWHKDFWVGAEPSSIRIDFNTPYLISTKAIPNYDTTLDITSAANNYKSAWANMSSAQKSIVGSPGTQCSVGAAGLLGTTGCIGDVELKINGGGAHEYVGPLPSWQVLYLLTYDDTLRDETLTNADLMGYFPLHFREADQNAGSGHFFDSLSTPTQGRFISINARPLIALHSPGDSTTNCGSTTTWAQDNPQIGTITQGNWIGGATLIGASHAPDIAYLPYLITGKSYYLDELLFQGAKDPSWETGCIGSGTAFYTDHQGSMGLFTTESERQSGWGIRTLARAAFMAPDNSPEQAYLTEKLNNNLAFLEGTQGMADDFSANTTNAAAYNYGSSGWAYSVANNPPPLGYFVNSDAFVSPTYGYTAQADLTTSCGAAQSNFMEYYLMLGLGVAEDLGFNSTSMLRKMAVRPLHVALDSTVNNIYLIGDNSGDNPSNPSLGLGYAYCQRDCTTWKDSNGNVASPTAVAETVGGSCTVQGAWLSSWSNFKNYFGALPSSWNNPGQMEDNYTAEAAAALGYTTEFTIDGLNGAQAYSTLSQSAAWLPGKFSTLSPKWDILPRQ